MINSGSMSCDSIPVVTADAGTQTAEGTFLACKVHTLHADDISDMIVMRNSLNACLDMVEGAGGVVERAKGISNSSPDDTAAHNDVSTNNLVQLCSCQLKESVQWLTQEVSDLRRRVAKSKSRACERGASISSEVALVPEIDSTNGVPDAQEMMVISRLYSSIA